MPTNTDLSVSPYFDDYNENKDYYKILFRPGVAVQTRELNQLQTILQHQVERFGDNIYKRGTIIDGCDITFHSSYPYVKIRDSQTDGAPANIQQYVGYYVRNEANISPLIGTVQTVIDGYESRSPDLKTLYIRYINTGYANNAGVSTVQTTFAANQTLTVYDPNNPIEKITSFDGSAGFANTDAVVILSAIAIQNSSGGKTFANNFFVGDHIGNGTANVRIVSVDTTSNSQAVILGIRPRPIDLKAANSALWTIEPNTSIQSTNVSPSSVATVVGTVGTGARAILRTGSQGEINTITVTSRGEGYYIAPTVSIASVGATTSQISSANLIPQTFLTKIVVANDSVFSVGTGYATTVGSGVIYQKGYFSRVNEHLVVVDKYSTSPDGVVVGFDTTEEIINSNQDTSLLDNATGEPNETAPGADRLKLTPSLVVKTKAEADANTDFLSIVEFSNGNPYKQNKQTIYNVIGNEIARRTFEESGNYVIDQFILNTKAANTLGDETSTFKIQIDPGAAYVNGKRIETVLNYETSVDKGTDTFVSTNANISINYGNYVRVNNLSGIFKFNLGDLVTLYPNPGLYYQNTPGAVPSTSGLGSALGTARIRSLVHESGIPGTAECTYRLYLFDIRVATAQNITLVKSIFYNGSNKGVADTVLEGGICVIKDNNLNGLLYSAGRPAVKTGNSFTYIYRTLNDSGTVKIASNGIITFSTSGGETFPYTPSSQLSTNQENDIVVVPLANVQASANIAGSISCNGTSNQVNGTSTSFISTIKSGDFITIANSTTSIVRQVSRVANDSILFLTSNGSSYTGANASLFFPANVPISLDRANRTVNVGSSSNTLTINLGMAVSAETNVAVAYNVRTANVTPVVKTVNRNQYVRLNLSNNATSNSGPWVIGVPDVIRLRGVYLGSNATFTESQGTDITSEFYVDHNQNENFYGISYLYKRSTSTTAISNTNFLLVKFDYFTDSGEGLKAPGTSGTYPIDDTKSLANSSTSVNTLEIPEVYSAKGDVYDLRDNFDFRPRSANTVAPSANASLAPVNPTEPSDIARFAGTDKKFPAPSSSLTGTVEYYLGRTDRVIVDENNQFTILRGAPGASEAPTEPSNALTINLLNVPPYPSHPYRLSADTVAFADTKIANEKFSSARLKNYRIDTPIDSNVRRILQTRGYTMQDIGTLERRISDLEYYVSYTLVESLVQKRNIPSSANVGLDRAKFGFFVDSFENYNFSEVDAPGYAAAIVDGFLSPAAKEINLPLKSVIQTDTITLPYVEKTIVSQTQATDGPLISTQPPSNTNPGTGTVVITPAPGANNNSNTLVQTTSVIRQSQRTTARSDSGLVYEDFFYTMSQNAGPVELYLNSRDNNIAIEVFQSTSSSNGPWTSILTSAAASAITSSDILTKSLSLNGGRKIEHPGTLNRKSYGPAGRFIEDQFKLLWTHQSTDGVYYRLRVYKGKNHGAQGQSGTFEYKMYYPIDVPAVTNVPIVGYVRPTTGYSLNFNGQFIFNTPAESVLALSQYNLFDFNPTSAVIQPVYDNTAVASEQSFSFLVTGLKPNTPHIFKFEGTDVTAKVKQDGKTLGTGLISDANGTIKFVFYYYPDIVPTSNVSADAAYIARAANVKTIRLESSDNTSFAVTTIQVQGYVKTNINTPPVTPTTSNIQKEINTNRGAIRSL